MAGASHTINPAILAKLSQIQQPLAGLGANAPQTALDAEIDGFLLRSPNPSSSDVADFLKLYVAGEPRNIAAKALIARGVAASNVSAALTFLNASSTWSFKKVGGVLAILSAMVSGFHGYRRNRSVGWGLYWFVAGGIFPVVTPVIAVAQGFAKRKAS